MIEEINGYINETQEIDGYINETYTFSCTLSTDPPQN